jgi:hypothetical protein
VKYVTVCYGILGLGCLLEGSLDSWLGRLAGGRLSVHSGQYIER